MINSRNKGARGEREFARWLHRYEGVEARRGQQYAGSGDSPDVVHNIPGIHFEVKFNVQRMGVGTKLLADAVAQAELDCPDRYWPVVAWKQPRGQWLFTFRGDELILTASAADWMHNQGYALGDG